VIQINPTSETHAVYEFEKDKNLSILQISFEEEVPKSILSNRLTQQPNIPP